MSNWFQTLSGVTVAGAGNQALLAAPMTAFFASRQCPGAAIRSALDWAVQQARQRRAVVSGFHSPLEQSVLKVLIEAASPAIVVIARPIANAKFPPEWAVPLQMGYLTVISDVAVAARLTRKAATARNLLAARLGHEIVVAHASADGGLAALCDVWRAEGRAVTALALPNR